MAKFLDSNGLLYFWQQLKTKIPSKTSDLTNDSGFITSSDIPEGAAASNTPRKWTVYRRLVQKWRLLAVTISTPAILPK